MKIGEFARLGQVSVRMLRHYETLGLLQPYEVDHFSGHRSYSVAQLTRLNRIMALNSLGIPLRKVAEAGTEVACGYRATASDGQNSASLHAVELHADDLRVTELPSCTAGTLIHEGSMSRIGASWQHLSEWCVTQGYSLIGPCREVYLEVGDDSADSSNSDSDRSGWVVELQQPITS